MYNIEIENFSHVKFPVPSFQIDNNTHTQPKMTYSKWHNWITTCTLRINVHQTYFHKQTHTHRVWFEQQFRCVQWANDYPKMQKVVNMCNSSRKFSGPKCKIILFHWNLGLIVFNIEYVCSKCVTELVHQHLFICLCVISLKCCWIKTLTLFRSPKH